MVENICHANPSAVVSLGSDLNLLDINWGTNSIVHHQYWLCVNELFMGTLANRSLSQLATFPTCNDNTLDIFATNRPGLVTVCESLPGISNHDIVHVQAVMSIKYQKRLQRKIYL